MCMCVGKHSSYYDSQHEKVCAYHSSVRFSGCGVVWCGVVEEV